MAIPLDQLQRAVDAGHPEDALVGFPISLVREILRRLPVETIDIPNPLRSAGASA
jgi:hypothetical protein